MSFRFAVAFGLRLIRKNIISSFLARQFVKIAGLKVYGSVTYDRSPPCEDAQEGASRYITRDFYWLIII